MTKALRLLAGNLLVLTVMLISLNLVSYLGLTTLRATRAAASSGRTGPQDARATLPNYEGDRERANTIFEEFNGLDSEYMPFVGWTRLSYQGEMTTIDEAGDRVHRPPPYDEDPVGIVRFFGGSTMWGTGADDDGTIPAIFNRLHPEYRVYNHGETGYTSRQALDRLITLLSAGHAADLVVFLDGANDVAAQCRTDIPVPGHGRVLQIRDALNQMARPSSGIAVLRDAAHILFLESTVLATRAVGRRVLPTRSLSEPLLANQYECDTDAVKARLVAQTLLANWTMARALVEAQGGSFIGILQPNAFWGSPRTDHIEDDLNLELGANYSAVYPEVIQLLEERNDPWMVDLSDTFDGDEFLLIDWVHAARPGNQILVEKMEEVLRERGWSVTTP